MKYLALLLFLVWPFSAVAQDNEPVLEITFEERETIPGQPLTLRLTVFVPTFMPKPPVWPSFETPNLRIRLPEKSTSPTSRTINGETWSGISRRYQVTPVVPGSFSLPPSVLQITYRNPDGGPELSAELPIEALDVTGVLPEGAEDLSPFVAATKLTLKQDIEGTTEDMDAGQSFSRVLTAEVDGLSPYFLPTLTPDVHIDGLRAYPETPSIDERDNRGLLSGTRTERTVYLAETALADQLPAVSIDWFNLKTGEIETATAEAIAVSSKAPPPPPKAPLDWQRLFPYILAVVLLAALAWAWFRWLAAPIRNWQVRRRAAYLASEPYAFKQVQRACKDRDLDGARQASDIWQSRVSLTEMDKASITNVFLAIGRARFGSSVSVDDEENWHRLKETMEAARQSHRRYNPSDIELPPLNP